MRELPWVLGVCAGLWLLRAGLFGPFGPPSGSDYGQYLHSADFIWHHRPDGKYYDWRPPLYPYLLGLLGESTGYVVAGHLLARASTALLVVSAGLGARLFAGPWAGAAAALLVACTPFAQSGASWVNLYPLLAAAVGLVVVGTGWLTRGPGPGAAAFTALAAGACFLVDARGLVLAGPALLLALLLPWSEPGWRRAALATGLAALAFGAALGVRSALPRVLRTPQLSVDVAIRAQSGGAPEDEGIAVFLEPDAPAPCLATSGVSAALLHDPCAVTSRARNLADRVRGGDVPAPPWLWLPILGLVPVGRTRAALRGSVAWLALLGGGAVGVFVAASLAPFPDRYVAPVLVLLAMGLPVALGRAAALGSRAGGLPRWGQGLAGLLAAALAVGLGAVGWFPAGPAAAQPPPFEHHLGTILAWLPTEVGRDDVLYDCTSLDLAPALAPDRPWMGRCASSLGERPEDVPIAQDPPSGRALLVASLPREGVRREGLRVALEGAGWVAVEGPAVPDLSWWRVAPEGAPPAVVQAVPPAP